MTHLWKKHGLELGTTWKEVFAQAKNAELRYRVSLADGNAGKSLQMKSKKSCVNMHEFILNV